jgi:hypothetical protein
MPHVPVIPLAKDSLIVSQVVSRKLHSYLLRRRSSGELRNKEEKRSLVRWVEVRIKSSITGHSWRISGKTVLGTYHTLATFTRVVLVWDGKKGEE